MLMRWSEAATTATPKPAAIRFSRAEMWETIWPMRGLKRHRSAPTLAAGHALVQNLRRDHYDIATEGPGRHRLRLAFDDLALAI